MILRIAGIMALGMSFGVAQAAAGRGMDQAMGQAIWNAAVNGRTTTLGVVNSPGQIRVVRPTTTGTPVRGAGGSVAVTDVVPLPVAGVNVPVSATTNVAKEVIIDTAVGLAAGGVLGAVGAGAFSLTTAWLNQSNVRSNPLNPAVLQVPESPDLFCFSGTCYWWSETHNAGQVYRTQEAACNAYATWYMNTFPGRISEWHAGSTLQGCSGYNKLANGTIDLQGTDVGVGIQRGSSRPADSPTWHDATSQEVKDALYKNDPPPAIIDELSKYGNIIWPGPASVTGPSSVTGPKTTTNSTSGNQSSQTISQTSTPLTYQGASVTAGNPTTTSTTTTTTSNPDGSTSTSSSTTTTTTEEGTSSPETPAEETSPTDTALPPVPDLYQRKYPNGMEGIWGDYKEQLKGTDLVSLVGKLMPNVGDGGSCPTWPINLELAQWASYGTHDVAPPCWIWDVAKAILILSALLLARSLVFGG